MWMNWHDSTSPGIFVGVWHPMFGIQWPMFLFCNFIWYLLIFSFFIKSITISFNESYHITKLSHIYNLGPNLAMNAWTRGSDFKIFLAAAVTLLLFSARAWAGCGGPWKSNFNKGIQIAEVHHDWKMSNFYPRDSQLERGSAWLGPNSGFLLTFQLLPPQLSPSSDEKELCIIPKLSQLKK